MTSPLTVNIRITDLEEFQDLIKALADNAEQLPEPVVVALQRLMVQDDAQA